MTMKKIILLIAAFTFSAPAFAYLDPGSGSAILSAIIGVIVAAGMAVKTYWYKIKSIFVKKMPPPVDPKDQP